jgi:hypothetical protein
MEVPMQDKGSPSPSVAEEDAMVEQAVMRLLLEDRGLFTFGEVNKNVGGKVVLTADALDRLKQGGMVHDFAEFVFASRAAVVTPTFGTMAASCRHWPADRIPLPRAVMALALETYPHWRTIPELAREIGSRGPLTRAVLDLIALGLLENHGTAVRPTKPIAHFARLKLP